MCFIFGYFKGVHMAEDVKTSTTDKVEEAKLNRRNCINAACEIIKNALTDKDKENRVLSIPRTKYYDYMKQNEGLNREVVDKVYEAESHFLNGCVKFCGDELADHLKSLPENERKDAMDANWTVKVNTPSGMLKVNMQGIKDRNNPRDGSTIRKYGPTTINWKKNLLLDKDLQVELETQIRDQFAFMDDDDDE